MKTIRLMADYERPGDATRWLILPTMALRALVKRTWLKLHPELNYVCEWLDANGFGLHMTRADWVPEGHVYEVPDRV